MKPLMKLLTGITLGILLGASVDAAVGTFTFKTTGASDTVEAVSLVYPQRVPEAGSVTNDKLAEPISVANGGTGATTAAAGLAALGGASLNGSSTVDFAAQDLEASGFTTLGDAATGIKMKVVTGTTPDTEGQNAVIETGVAPTKLISYGCNVGNPASSLWPPNTTLYDGYLYYTYIDSDGRIVVFLDATDSENLLSAPVLCVVWYKE